jgi:hypothetical protein
LRNAIVECRGDVGHLHTGGRTAPQVTAEEPDVRTFSPVSRITDVRLSFAFEASHDGVVRTTLPSAAPTPSGGRSGASTRNAAADLERFWPSRRGHAFDEFCR